MKLAPFGLALAFVSCVPVPRAPLAPAVARSRLSELAHSVALASRTCPRSILIPAKEAVVFTTLDSASLGCAAKAVRVALERCPLPVPVAVTTLEPYALSTCDPLHPTTSVRVFIDPNVAPVEPEYP